MVTDINEAIKFLCKRMSNRCRLWRM